MKWKISGNFTFDTELSGRNEFGLFMKITNISDVLKEQMSWKERFPGGGGGSSLLLIRIGV